MNIISNKVFDALVKADASINNLKELPEVFPQCKEIVYYARGNNDSRKVLYKSTDNKLYAIVYYGKN